jgi:hypothetical protein
MITSFFGTRTLSLSARGVFVLGDGGAGVGGGGCGAGGNGFDRYHTGDNALDSRVCHGSDGHLFSPARRSHGESEKGSYNERRNSIHNSCDCFLTCPRRRLRRSQGKDQLKFPNTDEIRLVKLETAA